MSTACSSKIASRIESCFSSEEIDGCTVVWPDNRLEPFISDNARARARFVPASTFKILNSLIALELGVITREHVVAYDGTPVWSEDWKRPMSLQTAFELSAVWFFKHIARKVGRETYGRYLSLLEYGNAECGEAVENFWLDGTLLISPVEQVALMRKLSKGDLPFRSDVLETVRDIMKLQSPLRGCFRGKTGWYDGDSEKYGWIVGYYEVDQSTCAFATHIDMPTIATAAMRQRVTERCLQVLIDGIGVE